MKVKKEEKLVIGKTQEPKLVIAIGYCNKTTKSFCYFTKKNLNCPCLKSFISNERRKSLKNKLWQLHKNPMEAFFSW